MTDIHTPVHISERSSDDKVRDAVASLLLVGIAAFAATRYFLLQRKKNTKAITPVDLPVAVESRG